jgi:DNA-directed RNA polymerase subunit RPC12/RpoP
MNVQNVGLKIIMETKIVKELLFLSYSNLAMAHSAIDRKQTKYGVVNYSIRAKLYKGLKNGTMNMRSLFDDEKIKLSQGLNCNYCGSSDKLSLDHIFPQNYGGRDTGDNLIYACKTCNSSKGKKDLMQWYIDKNEFPPLMIIRRYLKLIYNFCVNNDLLNEDIEMLINKDLPFNISLVPIKFPKPDTLILTIN